MNDSMSMRRTRNDARMPTRMATGWMDVDALEPSKKAYSKNVGMQCMSGGRVRSPVGMADRTLVDEDGHCILASQPPLNRG